LNSMYWGKKGKRNRLFDIARENKRLLLFEEE
jgi:hypothetical protein